MELQEQQPQISEQHIAALDIGSNSFHFVLARVIDDQLQILHSEKHQVKLADGLDDNQILNQASMDRGIEALSKLASIVGNITQENFRIVATYTLRAAKNAKQFLAQATAVFPYDIEVISGHEEARLIYQGVSHYLPPDSKRLVLDIGGGSTECIIGKGEKVFTLDSMNIGCVSIAKKFFKDEKISKSNFSRAITHASLIIEAIRPRFLKVGFESVVGTSGTIKSIYNIANFGEEVPQPLTLEQLYQIRTELLSFKRFDDIEIDGLKPQRQHIICSGLAVLIALFEVFNIKSLDFCDYSLREGVLFEQLEEKLNADVHQRTTNSLIARFNIDSAQIDRVSSLAISLFSQVKTDWKLSKNYQTLLQWAAQLHEIGIDINPSGFHKHGRYIIENTDLPGFNQEQTNAVAWLVGCHRKKIQLLEEQQWYLFKEKKLYKLLIILRVACLLTKQRQLSDLPDAKLSIKDKTLTLSLQEEWLVNNPLMLMDLEKEQALLNVLDIELELIEI